MKKVQIYLAGPISGLSYEGCTDWREHFIEHSPEMLVGLSPMRSKSYLSGEDSIADDYADSTLSCQRGIFARDSWDCRRCDAILVNLLGAERVSIGTVMEIAWGHVFNKPIVLVMENESNIHDHAMIREACPYRVDNLEDAYFVLAALFDTESSHY